MACTATAIESINARICVAVMSPDPTGADRKRRINRRKAALNAFGITFGERLPAGRKQNPSQPSYR